MKIEEKLQLVLDYAIKNGFDLCGYLKIANNCSWTIHQWQNVVDVELFIKGHKKTLQLDTILFDHGFAKVVWGDEKNYRLQMLSIIAPDERLDYVVKGIK